MDLHILKNHLKDETLEFAKFQDQETKQLLINMWCNDNNS